MVQLTALIVQGLRGPVANPSGLEDPCYRSVMRRVRPRNWLAFRRGLRFRRGELRVMIPIAQGCAGRPPPRTLRL